MLRIGDQTITDNVTLFRETVTSGWSLDASGELPVDVLDALIAQKPEIIVVGAGWQTRLPPRDLVFRLAREGIGFEIMDTPAACRTFNILVSEDRDVAALLVID